MDIGSDERGQAIQVGAVLIFGFIVVLLSTYQAFVVPSQNQEIEFNHYQTAERDMVDLRSEILQAKTTGEDRYTTVQLGTEFPNRILARNPPDPSGSLRTTENRTIAVEATVNGQSEDLAALFDRFEDSNRHIEYTPRYAEFYNSGTIRYENTVVYNDYGETTLTLSNQRLLRDDTISLIPLHQKYQASGGQTAPIEPVPGILETREVEDPTVTLGTELSEDKWEDLLAEEIAANDNLDPADITVQNGELELDLQGTYELEYAPVGMDRAPFGGSRGGDILDINPAAPGDIELVKADWSQDTVTLTFKNTADEANSFSKGRIAFYDRANPSVNQVRVDGSNRAQNTPWSIPGSFQNLDPNVELPGNNTQQVEIVFDRNLNPSQEWFVLEFRFETGETATYFVGSNFDNT